MIVGSNRSLMLAPLYIRFTLVPGTLMILSKLFFGLVWISLAYNRNEWLRKRGFA